jgi:hypothetical protein
MLCSVRCPEQLKALTTTELMFVMRLHLLLCVILLSALVAGSWLCALTHSGCPNLLGPHGCHRPKVGNTYWLNNPLVMNRVVPSARHNFQVLDPVVVPDAIFVMNNLALENCASEMFRHHKHMFANIPTLISIGVAWDLNKDVSVSSRVPTPFIARISLANPRSLWSSHSTVPYRLIPAVSNGHRFG